MPTPRGKKVRAPSAGTGLSGGPRLLLAGRGGGRAGNSLYIFGEHRPVTTSRRPTTPYGAVSVGPTRAPSGAHRLAQTPPGAHQRSQRAQKPGVRGSSQRSEVERGAHGGGRRGGGRRRGACSRTRWPGQSRRPSRRRASRATFCRARGARGPTKKNKPLSINPAPIPAPECPALTDGRAARAAGAAAQGRCPASEGLATVAWNTFLMKSSVNLVHNSGILYMAKTEGAFMYN